jgi:hypothetical protein
MAQLRVEIAIVPFQVLTCETCGWTSIRHIGPTCINCGIWFDEAILVLSDENNDLLVRATSKPEPASI